MLISLLVLVPFMLYNAGFVEAPALDRMEQFAYDMRLQLTMPNTPDRRLVIVDLDEISLAAEGQWPWARDKVATLVDQLFDLYGARVVGFDVFFPEPDRDSGLGVLTQLRDGALKGDSGFAAEVERLRPGLETDRIFADALEGRDVVLGYVFRDFKVPPSAGMLPDPVLSYDALNTTVDFIRPLTYSANIPALQLTAASGGFVDNPTVDPDGVYRRVPVLQQYGGNLFESLALAVARLSMGSPPIDFYFDTGVRDGLHLEWLTVGTRKVPVDAEATVLVPYRGNQNIYTYVSATDVLHGRVDPSVLRDKIVLVGTSAPGLHDLRITPVGEKFNGVEVHANIISGFVENAMKHHPRFVQGIEMAAMLIIGLLMTAMLMQTPVIRALLLTVMIMVTIIAVNLYAWQYANFVVPLVSLLVLTFLIYFFHMIYGLFVETRGKRMLSTRFGQYVPPELVEEMGRNPKSFRMDSESRQMTVLFSDIRNFTNIAEALEPRELSQLMNEFLTPMTQVIHRNRGTIDKYMGDAIMAFWGAPINDPDHASNALKAAIEMQEELEVLKARFAQRGWPEIRVGIGINSGTMRVGNMGSEFRVTYTVLGDAVNLGSRLEGLTKKYGADILVGERTVSDNPDYAFLELDRVRVKGKDVPAGIFQPLGWRSELTAAQRQMLSTNNNALAGYRGAEWDRAESAFFQLHQSHPDKQVFQMYLDRIAFFRSHPPQENWDGVFTHESK
ncbi:MAG: adenylate/guanylate cyclase domain-containing protein [Pseudomonadota bacterium]